MNEPSQFHFEIDTLEKWNSYSMVVKNRELKGALDFDCPPCVFNDEKEFHFLKMQEISFFLCRFLLACLRWPQVFNSSTLRCLAPGKKAEATMQWVKTNEWPRGSLMLCGCQNCVQVRGLIWHNTRAHLLVVHYNHFVPEKFIDYPFETIPVWTPSHNKPS